MATKDEIQYCDLLTPVVCDGCDNQNDVTNYCLQCNANICGECTSTHWDTRLHRDHIVLPLIHPEVVKARRSIKVLCSDHEGKDFVTYCIRCEKPCCASCITEKHNGHEFTDLEKKIYQTVSKIDEIVHDMETNLIPIYEKSISQLGKHMEMYESGLNNVKRISKERLENLIQQLKDTHEVFLNEVDTHGERNMNIIKGKKLELERNLEKVKKVTQRGKIAPLDASLFLMLYELSKVSTLRPSMITCPDIPSYSASSFKISPANEVIGSFNTGQEKTFPQTSTDDLENDTQVTSFDPRTIEVKVLKKINGINAKSILCFPNEEVWIYDNNTKCIHVYDEHIYRTKSINIGISCQDMSLYGEKEVIVVDLESRRIFKISRSGGISFLCEMHEDWFGIYANIKQHIVAGVFQYVEDDDCIDSCPWKLQVYSKGGSFILQKMEDEHMFWEENIKNIRQTVTGEYVVALDSNILCLNKDLKQKWTYMFSYDTWAISCLHCDKYSNILVGDMDKNEIVMLNMDGQRVRTLLTAEEGICDPFSIDVDSKGRLWIGQKQNILIATYLN